MLFNFFIANREQEELRVPKRQDSGNNMSEHSNRINKKSTSPFEWSTSQQNRTWSSCFFLLFQKSNLMFKRLDASTLPEDILSNTQTLPMMPHSAGSALWDCAHLNICCTVTSVSFYVLVHSFSLSKYRTRGGFVALSPISPQELFMQPMSSDVDVSQQQNLVRNRTYVIHSVTPHPFHRAVVLNL